VGSVSAIYQKRIKRLFAFSTIAHTGFMLLAFLSCCLDSAQALVFYIIVYSCLTVTLFGVLTSISLNTKIQPRFLINFSGLAFKNYSFAFSFSLLIFAIAGIPPLAGFFSKFFILLALIGLKYYFASFLVLFFSSIACFYYIRLIKIIFFINNFLFFFTPKFI
jgi:NADH-quinone oxidoreductase subunit N